MNRKVAMDKALSFAKGASPNSQMVSVPGCRPTPGVEGFDRSDIYNAYFQGYMAALADIEETL